MRNKMGDVRDHLVGMMEELGSPKEEVRPDTIERAKAMSLLAGQYIAAVKTEIDAARVAHEIGYMPAAIEGSVAEIEHDGTTKVVRIKPRAMR